LPKRGLYPVVELVTETCKTGAQLTKQAMAEVENKIQRLTCLEVDDKQLDFGKALSIFCMSQH
jgi:hypothetical protein